ncbi:hypothetical protein TrLO_g15831 [Triparma laevis f. longispina]|uniref:Uncharacterized protein n=1 Tax=Triparma laevis f. longispina TaxID=1714387 RepID=A0A9W7EDV8_9STRA|nr:hypothetical protein TrLO_g15831 [Triparma laevis f. longispina]
MPYLGKAPFTIASIQPLVPGLIISTITKEDPIESLISSSSSSSSSDNISTVQVASLRAEDVRGNKLEFVSKRSKQRNSSSGVVSASFQRDMAERLNECYFYLHYSDFYHTASVTIPKAWSIKVPPPPNPNHRQTTNIRDATSISLLLSNLSTTSASFPGTSTLKLDYYQTVSALTYLAEFHAIHWESKDEESTIFSFGGHGNSDYDLTQGESSGSWGDLGEKLYEMRIPLRKRIKNNLLCSRKHRTIVHGYFSSKNLIIYPNMSEDNGYPKIACTDFKLAGLGYGVYDVAILLGKVLNTVRSNATIV